MNTSTPSSPHASTLPPTNRREYRDLEQLLDEEEELATRGLVRGTRRLGRDALDTLGIRRRPGRHGSLASTVVAAGLLTLLIGRRRRGPRRARRRSRVLPLVLRFATSSLLGALPSMLLGSKRDNGL